MYATRPDAPHHRGLPGARGRGVVTGGWGTQPSDGVTSGQPARWGDNHGLCDDQVRSLLREIDLLKRQNGQLWDDLADRDAQIAMLRDQVTP
jgi:hypothetical protein